MKNNLIDLNNHLFAQLERLGNESLKGEKLEEEITRSKAVSQISKDVVSNASVVLQAEKHRAEYNLSANKLPGMLEVKDAL